ncbi:rab11 family-interacting protein 4 [Gracilinanus agilis]|uniref:rab11 family-interacting protein 4 n=1 Tax=Gracilinanus agilis TaxID=191870 RepID=UPI001CFCEFC3|nr:rab11 family-interacting protein 4 [Gracilinanus agilis]
MVPTLTITYHSPHTDYHPPQSPHWLAICWHPQTVTRHGPQTAHHTPPPARAAAAANDTDRLLLPPPPERADRRANRGRARNAERPESRERPEDRREAPRQRRSLRRPARPGAGAAPAARDGSGPGPGPGLGLSAPRALGWRAAPAGLAVEKLVKYLDPNDMGRINFKDFCHGVFAMKGCEEVLKDVLAMESTATLQYEPEIGDYEDQNLICIVQFSVAKTSPNRKISSTAFGRQLMHHSNFSSSNGSTEDLFRDSIDSCDNDLTEKVSFLEKKVTELENDSLTNGDLKSKLKQENTQLVHRVHELEEIMKDQETTAEQTLEEEIKRHRELLSKLEKEKGTEIELLNTRVQQLEEENTELRTTVTRLKCQTEKLDEERQRMSDRLEDTSLRLKDEMDLYKRMMDKLRQNRMEFHKEREATQELIEDLRKELEHLQLYKLDCERPGRGRSSSSCMSEFNARAREIELEHEIKRLKQENQKLRDQNDDLNGQILSLSLYEAKNLFATQTKAQSLAAEIDSASRDELMEALKEQEEINYRLRQYMDKIILAILDHNPSILEIKN